MVAQKITTGYADGDFHPTASVSRQEMAAFMYRLKNPGQTPTPCTSAPFPDVPVSNPFCADIEWLVAQKITTGYADGDFHPTASVSRQEMAAFMYRLKNPGQAPAACVSAPFKDVPTSSIFCADIEWLVSQGVTSGYTDGGFHPAASVLRQEMAAFLDRLVNGGGDVVVPRPTTTSVAATSVSSVTGDPNGTQTTTLDQGAVVPKVGGVLVAPPSASAPNGVLGTVQSVSTGSGGTTRVSTTPATLDDAFSSFVVNESSALTSANTSVVSNAEGSKLTPRAGNAPSGSGLGVDPTEKDFTCDGSGGKPTISVSADLSNTQFQFHLDANPFKPSIRFALTSKPVFEMNVQFAGERTCTYKSPIQVVVPIPALPALRIVLRPTFTITARGQANADFKWSPQIVAGFAKGSGVSPVTNSYSDNSSVTFSATAGVEGFFGLAMEANLAGRVGIGGVIGPDIDAEYDSNAGCATVTGSLKLTLDANVDIFVKSWNFDLGSVQVGSYELYKKCAKALSVTISGFNPQTINDGLSGFDPTNNGTVNFTNNTGDNLQPDAGTAFVTEVTFQCVGLTQAMFNSPHTAVKIDDTPTTFTAGASPGTFNSIGAPQSGIAHNLNETDRFSVQMDTTANGAAPGLTDTYTLTFSEVEIRTSDHSVVKTLGSGSVMSTFTPA